MKLVDLTGKRALVGGSTAGIGKAIALKFAQLGAEVCLIARDEEKLKHTCSELDSISGQKHSYIVADFSDTDKVQSALQSYLENNAGFHIVINNTGGPKGGPIVDAGVDEFLLAYKMHLVNNQNIAHLAIPGMKEYGYGRFINIISTSVREPIPNLGVSNTTRGAVASWAKTMANELGKFNITVNNILPGFIKTGRLESIVKSRAESQKVSEEEVKNAMKAMVPLGRFAEPEELANAAAFLASPAAGYVSGVSLSVDGGRIKSI